ncbi:MAG: purine-nucleoside phosphorylase [Bacilli bacterium]|nr:purine-nucleoside phosphorylase [Bacilli bacterium]
MTPHIEAKKEDIAKTVIMPGDPLRAKMIAETYLENPRLVNQVRNIFAYTGTYKGKEVTVFASGMGNPSMGIYSYELFHVYDVDRIIRVGSCGAYQEDIPLYDVILVDKSFSTSSYLSDLTGDESMVISGSEKLNKVIEEKAKELNIPVRYGNVHCADVFYGNPDIRYLNEEFGCVAVEMETFALFSNAYKEKKEASAILTVSDNLITHEETTSEERQNSFNQMIELALESI